MAADSGSHKMAVFQHVAFYVGTLVELQTPALCPVNLARISEDSAGTLKGEREPKCQGGNKTGHGGPDMTSGACKISLVALVRELS